MSAQFIAKTGRVKSWQENPEGRLPVSCTVMSIEDSYDGENGIADAITFAAHALRFGAGCAIDVSKLRPRGSDNGKGLIASGPVSFLKIFSVLNEVLRRGGQYRSGAVVSHCALSHPDINEYLTASRQELPWLKRCVDVTEEMWNAASQETKDLVLSGVRNGDIWLSKMKWDLHGERIYSNVCLEIYLRSKGTCLLSHINGGALHLEDIVPAFEQGMTELCELHGRTGVDKSGHYLSPKEDRQVGLGILGLANHLSIHGVTYDEFGDALALINKAGPSTKLETPALLLAAEWRKGIEAAERIARANRMERAFTIAPTATCSYNYTDLRGNTTCPEIAPPINRNVDRVSSTFGTQTVSYGDVEICSEVGYDSFLKVANGLVQMMTDTGLFHGYSLNWWSDMITMDENFIQDWFASPQTSLYYSLQVQPDTLRKDDAAAIIEDDDYRNIFALDEEEQFCSSCAE